MLAVKPGSPMVLGASIEAEGVNFAVFSRDAESMTLCLFERLERRGSLLRV